MDTESPTFLPPAPVRCTPLPDWVEHLPPMSSPTAPGSDSVSKGLQRLLHDVQIDLTGQESAWHCRTIRRVLDREGAEEAANLLFELDPAFQRLEIHFIRTRRGPDVSEHARDEAFHILRRETSLERSVLNGRQTVALVIPDVRTDDTVEVAITYFGDRSVLRRKYAGWFVFEGFSPWHEARRRLLRSVRRPLLFKEFNDPPKPETTIRGEVEEFRWELTGQERLEREDLSPPWLIELPMVQLTEYRDWAEVAGLFADLYDDDALPSELLSEIERIAVECETPAERAIRWLRFVQTELRYFAMSLGEGGLVPRRLTEIWRTRFGDCKDAALSYVAGARRLGLDACPALVSTTHGPILDRLLPSPGLFNHCIVRLRIEGTSHWLDPTLCSQAGTLKTVFQPDWGWALPITAGDVGLERPTDGGVRHYLDSQESIDLGPRRDSPAVYRRTVEFRFWAADLLRGRFATEGTGSYSKSVMKNLQTTWPDITQTGPTDVVDDYDNNRIEVSTTYEIRDCWKEDSGDKLTLTVGDHQFDRELQPLPAGGGRQNDIHLGMPRKITRHVSIRMPIEWRATGWHHVAEAPGARYTSELRCSGRVLSFRKEFIAEKPSVPAAEVSAYREMVGKLSSNLLHVYAAERSGKIRPPLSANQRVIRPVLRRAAMMLLIFALWALATVIMNHRF